MKRKHELGLLLAATAGLIPPHLLPFYGRSEPLERPKKKCLHCGNKHDHNNSWCSPECCKSYREAAK